MAWYVVCEDQGCSEVGVEKTGPQPTAPDEVTCGACGKLTAIQEDTPPE